MNNNQKNILQTILKRKHDEVKHRSKQICLSSIRKQAENIDTPNRGFIDAIRSRTTTKQHAVIAEIKKASPSKGIIRDNFSASEISKSYTSNGATCLSILTDEDFFQGSYTNLLEARNATHLPVIQKDFIIHPYQVYEAKILQADCILLIVSALTENRLLELMNLTKSLEIDVLVEVHNKAEMVCAIASNAKLIGVNNRNLRTFEVNLQTTLDMIDMLPPDRTLVTESGIHSRQDIKLMQSNDVHAFLVGEAFMKEKDPGMKLNQLFRPQ